MTASLIRSEFHKFRLGKWFTVLTAIGFALALLGVVGTAIENRDLLEVGATTPEAATSEVARYWFSFHLFSSMLGAVYITREYSNGSIGRTVLLSESRNRVLNAKLINTVLVSTVLALIVAGLAVATPDYAIDAPFAPAWTRDATLSVLGVIFSIVAAAVWGLMIGFIVRSTAAAIGILAITTSVLDETLFRLLPAIGKYSFTISLGAAFRDARPDLLSPLWGYIVALLWLGAVSALAYWTFARRDVL